MAESEGIRGWPPQGVSAPPAHWTMLLVGFQLATLGVVATFEAISASRLIREFEGGTSGSFSWGGNLGLVTVAFSVFDWIGIVAAVGVLTVVAAVAAFRDRHHWVIVVAATAWLVLVLPLSSVGGTSLGLSVITLLGCIAAASWRRRATRASASS